MSASAKFNSRYEIKEIVGEGGMGIVYRAVDRELKRDVALKTIKELLDKYRVEWNKPTEPFRVIGNIHYVGTAGLASYLITTPQGHILIDTVMPESTARIKENIARLGFNVADIKFLLNTHAHIDHTGGFAELKAEAGAQMVAGTADKPLLEGGYYPGDEKNTDLAFAGVDIPRVAVDYHGHGRLFAEFLLGGQLQGGFDPGEDDLPVDVLLVVHLIHDPQEVGTFHDYLVVVYV